MNYMNLSDTAIWNIKSSDYCCILSLISKNEAISLMQNVQNTELTGKWNILKHENLLWRIKMGEEILRFDDIEIKK